MSAAGREKSTEHMGLFLARKDQVNNISQPYRGWPG